MKQITHSEEKKMTVEQRIMKAPYEILADGVVIGTFRTPDDKPSEYKTIKQDGYYCPKCGSDNVTFYNGVAAHPYHCESCKAEFMFLSELNRASDYQDTGETQCPNCKFKYQLPKKDTRPSYFSIQHP